MMGRALQSLQTFYFCYLAPEWQCKSSHQGIRIDQLRNLGF